MTDPLDELAADLGLPRWCLEPSTEDVIEFFRAAGAIGLPPGGAIVTEVRRISQAEWLEEGRALFGEDYMKWRFVCPGCGHVASIEQFRKYKDSGASPDAAAQECIGRYEEGTLSWAEDNPRASGGPCDYAAYGLFFIGKTLVIGDDGKERRVFEFDRSGT